MRVLGERPASRTSRVLARDRHQEHLITVRDPHIHSHSNNLRASRPVSDAATPPIHATATSEA
jgi:hypothetical protein